MNKYFTILSMALITITSCEKSDDADENNTQQVVITNDSSDVAGRLYVEVRNFNNTSSIGNADVRLYLTYDDVVNNIPMYDLKSGSNGRVDFGYILQGNYYIIGKHQSGAVTIGDTTVAQILPRRTITRYLFME